MTPWWRLPPGPSAGSRRTRLHCSDFLSPKFRAQKQQTKQDVYENPSPRNYGEDRALVGQLQPNGTDGTITNKSSPARPAARYPSGHYRYFGIPRNTEALTRFRVAVFWLWRRSLGQRSQKGRLSLNRYTPLAARWLPLPRVCHPYPEQRLRVIIRGKSPVR